jgi:hypothetical protein
MFSHGQFHTTDQFMANHVRCNHGTYFLVRSNLQLHIKLDAKA